MMILCISTNPAIDRTLVIPGFGVGKVQRAAQEFATAGGKGLNVARAAHALGSEVLCMGLLAGHSGRLLADLLRAEGLPAAFTWLGQGESRTCTIVLDGAGGEPTVLNTVGPQVAREDWARLAVDIQRQAAPGAAALFSGSLPPGAPPEGFAGLFAHLAHAGCRAWVDTSGAALRAILDAPPYGVKVNGREIGEALGMTVETPEQALGAAQALQGHGVHAACITLGMAGAVLLTPEGAWRGRPPSVQAVTNVGSGDAFLAGLAFALQQGTTHAEALRRAIAAGAANTLLPIPGQLRREDYLQLLESTQVEAVGA